MVTTTTEKQDEDEALEEEEVANSISILPPLPDRRHSTLGPSSF